MHRIQAASTYRLELVSFFAGAVVMTFELAASRIIAPYIGSTIYIWTSIIGAVLAGLAVGYTIGGYLADRRQRNQDVMLLLITAAAFILTVDIVKDPLLGFIGLQPWTIQVQAFLASVVLFVLPTVVLGAVPPYLARLSLTDLSSSGRHIARINAAGTIGSLAGTFVTGYLLFGFVGTRPILGILALCLVAVSFLLQVRGWLLIRLLLTVTALGLSAAAPALSIGDVTVIKDIDTHYSRYVIGDTVLGKQPVRVLQPDLHNWESGVYRNANPYLVFPYTQALGDVAQLLPHTHHILMIGGGAFTVPTYVAHLSPANRIDAVEIDGQLVPISKQFFDFHQPSNVHIVQADGRQFLNHNRRQYGVAFLDAFSAQVPPFQLVTKEATVRIRNGLAPDGLVAVNIVAPGRGSGSAFAASVVKTYQMVFAHVAVLRVQPYLNLSTRQNLLLLASQRPLPIKAFEAATPDPAFRSMLANQVHFAPQQGIVLTDDYAPVERLLANY